MPDRQKEGRAMKARSSSFLEQLNSGKLRCAGKRITLLLSFFVVLGVFWSFKLTGITMAVEAFCGFQEHRHGEECLVSELVCTMEVTPGHTHDESCLMRTLVCE